MHSTLGHTYILELSERQLTEQYTVVEY